MAIKLQWITVLAFLALGGCYRPQEDEPDIIVTLEPEFTVDLFEERNPVDGTPLFGLWVESMAQFDCGNYQVQAITDVGASTISIQLVDIRKPDICAGDPGPARGFLPIGPLANGTYTFTLALNTAIQNEGILSVQNGHYELNLQEQRGIDFQNRVLETLPDGYVWGFVNMPSEQDQPLADQFIQNLKQITEAPILTPGFYSYFTISGTGQYFFHRSIAPSEQHRPFLRRLNGAPDDLRVLLQGYRNDSVRPLNIRCLSTVGAL